MNQANQMNHSGRRTDADIYPSYKPSHIDWIGEIPSHWGVKKLKYFAQIMNGKDYQEFVLEDGGYPVYGSGGAFARCSKFLHDKPSVLLGRKGSVSNPQFVIEPFWTSDTTYYTDIKNDVEPMFLFHLVKQIQFDLYIYGSAVPSMTKSVYDDMMFPYPPLPEQQAIVNYLDQKTTLIDELIAKKQSKIELLKEQRTALINHAVTKGLSSLDRSLSQVEMKDSKIEWIGEIPEHWGVVRMKYISDVVRGAILRPVDEPLYFDENGEWTYLNISDVTKIYKYLDFGVLRLSELGSTKSRKIEPSNLIITGSGSVGKVFINTIPVCVHDGFIPLLNLKADINFMFYYLVNPNLYEAIGKTNSQKNIYLDEVKDLFVTLPPLPEQQAIVAYLDEQTALIDKSIAVESQKIEKLKEYRQSLISAVVTGKVCVLD